MGSLKHKLTSNKGASMILVLGLFLICLMISSVILVAAASGSSRTIKRTTQQQSYLAVSSAAELLSAELTDVGMYVRREETHTYGCNEYIINKSERYHEITGELGPAFARVDDDLPDVINPWILTLPHPEEYINEMDAETTVKGALAGVIKRAVDEVYKKHMPYSETFTMALSESEERLPVVTCTFHMDEEYSITVLVESANSDDRMTVSLSAGEPQKEYPPGTCSCEHEVFYLAEEGGAFVNTWTNPTDPTNPPFEGVNKIVLTKIYWETKPKVIKGADTS